MPLRKELHFFSENWRHGQKWYQRFFRDVNDEVAIGEASVSYTYPGYGDTAHRIAEVVPNCKLVYVLRNPVDRTFSHYVYYRYYAQKEVLPLREAISANPVYLGASDYGSWLKHYLQYFSPSQIRVVLFEDFARNPAAFFRSMYSFVGVDPFYDPTTGKVPTNKAFKPRSRLLHGVYRMASMSPARSFLERMVPGRARPVLRNYIRSILASGSKAPVLAEADRSWLQGLVAPMIQELENLVSLDLSPWRARM
jgi:hypothetical protein